MMLELKNVLRIDQIDIKIKFPELDKQEFLVF